MPTEDHAGWAVALVIYLWAVATFFKWSAPHARSKLAVIGVLTLAICWPVLILISPTKDLRG